MLHSLPFRRHDRWRELTSASLDGELSYREAMRLERHLVACESCRALGAGLRSVKAAVARLPERAAPRSFALTPALAAGTRPAVRDARPPVALRLAGAGALASAVALLTAVAVDLSAGGNGEQTASRAAAPAGEAFESSAALGNTARSAETTTPAAYATAVPKYSGGGADAQGAASQPTVVSQAPPPGGSAATVAAAATTAQPVAQPVPTGALDTAADDGPGGVRIAQAALGGAVVLLSAVTLILWVRRRKTYVA